MTYPLSQKELESVSRLSIEARLAHFVKRVADWEEVWSLRNSEGGVLTLATEGQEAAPFLEPVRVLGGLAPRVLEEILGVVAAPREPDEERPDPLVIEAIELVERAPLAPPEAVGERAIVLGSDLHGRSMREGGARDRGARAQRRNPASQAASFSPETGCAR